MIVQKNACVNFLMFLSLFVFMLDNLKFGKADNQYEKEEVDKEIDILMKTSRKTVKVSLYEGRGCKTANLKNIEWCIGTPSNEYSKKAEMAHGEKCIEFIDKRYITSQCTDGEWKTIETAVNRAPYFTSCRPSTTIFYPPSGHTGMTVSFPTPTAYDYEDGTIYPQKILRLKYRRCSGRWWRWRRCHSTYYPHNGGYFAGSTRGSSYSIAYRATDRRGLSATCSFYITVIIGSCSTPVIPSYGSVSCPSGTTNGRTCYFYCQSGYTPSTTSTYCMSNGQWSNGGTFSCQAIVTCLSTNIPTLSNGVYLCSSYSMSATCHPVCNSGYRLTSSHPIVCSSSGQWQQAGNPGCVDITAPTIYNCPSSISKTSDISMTSAVVTWATPTASDNHDSTNPVPIKITGSINSGDRVEAGTTHTIVYAATDQAGNQKKCTFTVLVTTTTCSTLTPINNGYYSSCSHGFVYGSSCTYKCSTGFELQGSSVTTCQSTGSWSSSVPSCLGIICASPDNFTNGYYDCPTPVTYRTFCYAKCTTGYVLGQSSYILCSVNSTNDPYYVVTDTTKCEDKVSPTFVNCGSTSELSQTFNLEADKGKTTATIAYDIPEAIDNVDPNPVVTKIQGPDVGDSLDQSEKAFVQFQANDASGNPSAICIYEFNVTVLNCPALEPPTGGSIMCTADYIYGSVCTLSCNTGYELVDQATTECQKDMTWSAEIYCQKVKCPAAPTNPENGVYDCNVSTTYTYGTICIASCNTGFQMKVEPASTTCSAVRTWQTDVEPNCVDIEPPVIVNCIDKLTFTADKGLRSTIVTWTEPTATDNADPAPVVKQITGPEQGSVLTGEETVTFQATDNSNVTSLVCVIRLVVEVTECSSPPWPLHGQYSCDLDYIYGSTCTFTCDTGYELSGNGTAECQSDRTWSYGDTPPTCDIITCGAPEMREKGNFTCLDTKYEYLSTCSLVCDKGFSTSSIVHAKCLATKQWNYTSTEECTDVTPPTFSGCNTYQTFYAVQSLNGANVSWELPTATDNVDEPGDIAINKVSGPDLGEFIEVGESVVSYQAVDSYGNPSVENCNITLNVEEVVCEHPSVTIPDSLLDFECANYSAGTNCTLKCTGTKHIINGSKWISCLSNFTNGLPTPYWIYQGDSRPYCEEALCPRTLHEPQNGAIVYTDATLPIAYMGCNDAFDVPYNFDGDIYCRTVGNVSYWDPSDFPDCTRKRRPGLSLLKTKFYFSGECSSENAQEEIAAFVMGKQNFHSGTAYAFKSVTVLCPSSSSRKKREDDTKRFKRSASPRIEVNLTLSKTCDVIDYDAFLACESDLFYQADNVVQVMFENGTFNSPELGLEAIPGSFTKEEYANPACDDEGQVLEGLTECKSCSIGTYLVVPGNTCESCPVGTYNDNDSQTECKQCPQGYNTTGTMSKSADDCIAYCPAGHHSPSGLEPCFPCKMDQYQSEVGQTSCETCPEEQRTFKTGSAQCSYYDIVLKRGTYAYSFYDVPLNKTVVSYAFWYKMTSTDSLEIHLKDQSGTVLTVNFNEGIAITMEGRLIPIVIPTNTSNIWSHVAVSLNSYLNVYIDGTGVILNQLSPGIPTVSKVDLSVTSQADIHISGFGGFETALDVDAVDGLYSKCVLGSTVKLFGPDNIVDKKLADVTINPATCVAVDACLDDPCNSHLCTPTVSGHACTCNNGYSGVDCSIAPDNCYGNECENEATCVNVESGYTCTCPEGYTGSLCENPPVNGGWTAWSGWSICTQKCDGGIQERKRNCTNPPPDPNGDPCSGPAEESLTCNTVACSDLNPCLSSPCGSNSTCIETDSNFTCVCGPQLTGTLCSETLDSCHNHVCQNGATCVGAQNGVYYCTCAGLYTGAFCETELSDGFYWTAWSACTGDCNGSVSERSKICSSQSTYSTCVPETQKRNCTSQCLPEMHCNSSPCGSHAESCLEEGTSYKCVCSEGYTGTTCTETIDHCVGASCGLGTCVNSVNEYHCTCLEGYSGADCSVEPIDGGWSDWNEWSECNVTCGDGQKSRNRVCNNPPPGVGGASCQGEELQEQACNIDCSDGCESYTCDENGGECVVSTDGPMCHCFEGYTGDKCDTEVDPCTPDPCYNGGLCNGMGTNFTCSCTDGYTGETCIEEPVVSVWGVWSDWTECSQECGEGGLQTKNRTCNIGTTGEDCVGEPEDSLTCNNDTQCSECEDLKPKYGVIIACNMTNETKICSVSCREGFVVSNGTADPIGIYKCTNETGWDQTMKIPTCSKPQSPGRIVIRSTVPTNSLISCAKTEDVASGYQTNLGSSACGTSAHCQTRVTVSGCTNRRKKAVGDSGYSSVSFEFTYTIPSNDTESGDLEVAISGLEDTISLLENGDHETLAVEIDGETITLDNTNISVTPTASCPEGYTADDELCVGCSPGTYYNSLVGFCVECEQGTYQEELGQTTCVSCEVGYYTNSTGSYNASDCFVIPPEGYQYLPTEEPPKSTPTEESTVSGALIGGIVVAVVVFLIGICISVVICLKKNSNKGRVSDSREWANHHPHRNPGTAPSPVFHMEPKGPNRSYRLTTPTALTSHPPPKPPIHYRRELSTGTTSIYDEDN